MLLRWLFSLAASCYIVAALALLPAWLRTLRLPLAAWWPVYLAAELVVFGVLLTLTLWWFVWRQAAQHERTVPLHFARLMAIALVPLFGFLVIPIGCFVSLGVPSGVIAGLGVLAASSLGAAGFWYSARRR